MIKKFFFDKYIDKRGTLTPFNFDKILNKKIQRLFFVSLKKKLKRGGHAHKKGYQIFVCIKGKINFEIINKSKKFKFILNEKKNFGYIIPSNHWVSFSSNVKNSLLLVMCTTKFDKKDYIYEIDKL
jgi:dTDP-4-dehydrorhamnose 3,5-epimerase-like enzyme